MRDQKTQLEEERNRIVGKLEKERDDAEVSTLLRRCEPWPFTYWQAEKNRLRAQMSASLSASTIETDRRLEDQRQSYEAQLNKLKADLAARPAPLPADSSHITQLLATALTLERYSK